MDYFESLEIVGLIAGLCYLFLIIWENILCWLFGIIGSLVTVFLYFHAKLYLESILNIYYVLAGVYGWYYWKEQSKKEALSVSEWENNKHIILIAISIVVSIGTGFLMKKYTDSPRPFIDATMAIFSLSATVLEARKILSAWIYWFFINGVSIWLQVDRGLNLYSILSIFYTIMSIMGYLQWKKSYNLQSN